ncbi:MAG: copper-binding protein [Rickettsiaceae bacterium]|jgi:suppressor for copper-sensitivity B|nr:copper-binding protein [Rickettsiaceae bacterium]
MQARKYLRQLVLPAIFLFPIFNGFAANTEFQHAENQKAKSRLIASFYQEKGQEKLIAGFEIEIERGWKVYAPDRSGFGAPPSFNFAGSTNIDVEKFTPLFPESYLEKEQIGTEKIEYSTYKNKVIIPIELEVIDSKQAVSLEVEASYGLCKEICIPVNQKFSLTIPSLESDIEVLKNIQDYLENKEVNTPVGEEEPEQQVKNFPQISLLKALIIAFIGGAILNIMPCVLPVLSIKLLSVISHSRARASRIRFAFLSTILGIVFSFSVFAAIAVFLKSIGNAVGWGFQFQNPYFLLFLLSILMIFIANLLGLFEFNLGSDLGSVLNNKIAKEEEKKNVFIPNFLSGILAVLLATPCSAPFVGVAISFALSADVKEIFSIFTAMSLGLALPYIILVAFPSTLKLLPKPGNWMVRAKQLMAGFLAATAIWMVYILCDNIGFIAAIAAAILATLILPFFKITSRINFRKNRHLKIIIAVTAFALLIGGIFIIPNKLSYLDEMMTKKQQENWIKFDEAKIPELVAQGKTVVVDITADWCISCKANKLLVLNSKEVKAKLRDENIIAMRGDLTKPDQMIFDFMKKYHRYGIPFNIVFGPSAPEGILTSELLSKEALLATIKQASKTK